MARLGADRRGLRPGGRAWRALWAAHHLENTGDPAGAIAEAERGARAGQRRRRPVDRGDAAHHGRGTLNAQLGDSEEAVRHAHAALPVLDRLEANDDAIQARALLAVHAMSVGRLEEAEELDGRDRAHPASLERLRGRVRRWRPPAPSWHWPAGEVAEGLALYRAAAEELAAIRFPGMGEPNGLEPWALFGESLGATALAVHGTAPDDLVEGTRFYRALLAKSLLVLDPDRPFMDYPVAGLVLHGLGAWGLLRDAMPADTAVRLLVLAERFGYTRFAPTMSPARTEGAAEERAPGLAEQLRRDYAERTAPSLLPEARAAVSRVPA